MQFNVNKYWNWTEYSFAYKQSGDWVSVREQWERHVIVSHRDYNHTIDTNENDSRQRNIKIET